jgi:hypothetical protein
MLAVVRCAALAALALALAVAPVLAQATAQLSGTVRDESGGVLPGVTVTAIQTDTAVTRTTVTDATGTYVLPNLPTGPYRLEVSLPGFRTYVQTGIVLQVGAAATINAVLPLGDLAETVTVEAATPLVDVRSAGISDVVENERILELPLQGRQVTDLIVLAGAAVQTNEASTRGMQGSVGISVAGGQSFGVAYTLDGAMHNNMYDNLNLPLPFPDALQEFGVATGGLSAQSGMLAGAAVSAVTKSGTNSIDGNVFEFVRDKRFNATEVFAAVGPDGQREDDGLSRHQFGGTLGGPVVTDRLFFFGGYQGTILRQTPASNISYVPTAQMLAGDFTQFASPACNSGRQIVLRAPFVNNRVDPALFSPAALNLVRRLPPATDPCGTVTFSSTDDQNQGQAVGRIDFQRGSNHSIFGRYMATFVTEEPAYGRSDNVLTTPNPGIDNLAQSLTLGDTRVLGANTVNALRVGLNAVSVDRYNTPFFDPGDLGIPIYSYYPDNMFISVTGGFNIGAGTAAKGLFQTTSLQVGDDLTLVRGRHQLGIGANVAYWKSDQQTFARSGGNWTFNGQATGLGMADLLLARVTELQHGGPGGAQMQQYYIGLYAQDAWRASDRLTFNVGMRWEPFFGQTLRDGKVAIFDVGNFRNNVVSSVFVNAPAGFLYPGDTGFPRGATGLNTKWWNLSPRLGVAWDAAGDGQLAVRASYSLSYDFPSGQYHMQSSAQPPFGNRTQVNDPPGGFDDPYRHIGGDPHPAIPGPTTTFPPFGTYATMNPDLNAPRVQAWNVTLERQLARDWSAGASYLGSYTDRIWNLTAVNPGVFMGLSPCTIHGVSYAVCTTNANLNQRRVLYQENSAQAQFIGVLDESTDVGTQAYRGLKLSVRRRAATGLSVNANYTWSRCFGNAAAGAVQPQANSGYTNPADPAFDRGYCDQDRTHLLSLTAGAQTPEFNARALRLLASGWRVSGILSARSGNRLNVTTGRDTAFNGIADQRVDQVSDDLYGDRTLSNYFNRAAFAHPAPGAFGNFIRNSATGPGFWTVDLALSRALTIGAQHTLELRAEAFNLTNNFNWGDPNTNFGSGNFGRITTQAGAPRILQFGIKYGF